MNKPVTPTVQKALTAIDHFERAGRKVVGVSIEGKKFSVEFAQEKAAVSDADLVTMGE